MITESIASMTAASRAKVINVPVAKIITFSTEKKNYFNCCLAILKNTIPVVKTYKNPKQRIVKMALSEFVCHISMMPVPILLYINRFSVDNCVNFTLAALAFFDFFLGT